MSFWTLVFSSWSFTRRQRIHLDGMLNRIHAKGVRAGVALKPGTPLSVLEYVLEKCDTVLLMLINPGYAFVKAESQVPYGARKIRELREGRSEKTSQRKLAELLQVAGIDLDKMPYSELSAGSGM